MYLFIIIVSLFFSSYTIFVIICLPSLPLNIKFYRRQRSLRWVCLERQLTLGFWWVEGRMRGEGRVSSRLVDADKSTGSCQETAGEGIPTRVQWRRRRAAGGALVIDMATLRSVGRCERFGALQRRMPFVPRAPRCPLIHHTCYVPLFIERPNRHKLGLLAYRLCLGCWCFFYT